MNEIAPLVPSAAEHRDASIVSGEDIGEGRLIAVGTPAGLWPTRMRG